MERPPKGPAAVGPPLAIRLPDLPGLPHLPPKPPPGLIPGHTGWVSPRPPTSQRSGGQFARKPGSAGGRPPSAGPVVTPAKTPGLDVATEMPVMPAESARSARPPVRRLSLASENASPAAPPQRARSAGPTGRLPPRVASTEPDRPPTAAQYRTFDQNMGGNWRGMVAANCAPRRPTAEAAESSAQEAEARAAAEMSEAAAAAAAAAKDMAGRRPTERIGVLWSPGAVHLTVLGIYNADMKHSGAERGRAASPRPASQARPPLPPLPAAPSEAGAEAPPPRPAPDAARRGVTTRNAWVGTAGAEAVARAGSNPFGELAVPGSEREEDRDPEDHPSFPLEAFDDFTFETREPREWLALGAGRGGTPARSLYWVPEAGGHYAWMPCDVVGYDERLDKYEIRWRHVDKKKLVKRLTLIFDVEQPARFQLRIRTARRLRSEAECLKRLWEYINGDAPEDLPPLDEEATLRILSLAPPALDQSRLPSVDRILQEVRENHAYGVKLARYLYRMKDGLQFEAFRHMKLPPIREPPLAPEMGCLQLEEREFEFAETAGALQGCMIRTLPGIAEALDALGGAWMKYSHLRFLDGRLHREQLPLELAAFVRAQEAHMQDVEDQLFTQWRAAVMGALSDNLDGKYDFYVLSEENYAGTVLNRAMCLVTRIMGDQLRLLVACSVLSWVAFFEQWLPRARPPLPPIPFVGGDAWRDELPPLRQPLLRVALSLDEAGGFVFVPSLEAVEAEVLRAFDLMFTDYAKIATPESSLVPLLSSLNANIPSMPREHALVEEARRRIRAVLEANAEGPRAVMDSYAEFRYLFEADPIERAAALHASRPTLEEYAAEIGRLQRASTEVRLRSINEVERGMYRILTEEFKEQLDRRAALQAHLHLTTIASDCREQNVTMCGEFEVMLATILQEPPDIEHWVELDAFCKAAPVAVEALQKRIDGVQEWMDLLADRGHHVTDEEFTISWDAIKWPWRVYQTLVDNEHRMRELHMRFNRELKADQEQFQVDIREYAAQADSLLAFGEIEEVDQVADMVVNLKGELDKALARAALYASREKLFGVSLITEYPTLNTLLDDFEPVHSLWTTALEFCKAMPIWFDGPFIELNAEQVDQSFHTWMKTMKRLQKDMKEKPQPLRVVEHVHGKLTEFKPNLPLVQLLRVPGMRGRHWEKLSEAVGTRIVASPELTLVHLLELGLLNHMPAVREVSDLACKEYAIETALDSMTNEWRKMKFETIAYRETGLSVLRATEEVVQLLEDHLIKTQAMRASPYIKPFQDRVAKWEDQLRLVQDILDEWLRCQTSWTYLQPIFETEDIQAALPGEAKRFAGVDTYFRSQMTYISRSPYVLNITNIENVHAGFRRANLDLSLVQKGLNDYLESKRMAFPRFFFLSNDELIEILSQTKNPLRVQPHVSKCFEGIAELDFTPELDIVGMKSAEGEAVPFDAAVTPNRNVEQWLKWVEEAMRASLARITRDAVGDYYATKRRAEWVLRWPGQVVLAASQVAWTKECEEAISTRKGSSALMRVEQRLTKQLEDLVNLVRGDLTELNRITLSALVTLDVHGRDVVGEMAEADVSGVEDFEWLAQLRYYLEEGAVRVRMISASIDYGYEYLGNTPRLVITPLTDRCYRTLTQALQLNMGGAPEGPAGTGKTETTKDLAKAIAKQCFVFNCSDGLDYLAMGKFFKGLAAAGAWACFDEFNRIDIEVLSVIAQQILTIQRAIAAQAKKFTFEGVELALDRTCAIFVTMNPGYAGRTELPDNLKALFRPVTMMVPNYALIAEISLYSSGFKDARNLARKIVATFRLCSEQLSSQDHYDFGMRAVKAVLAAAARLRRESAEAGEAELVLRAIDDCNLPKFLSHDIPLFKGITSDLFPTTTLPAPDYEALLEAVREQVAGMNLQPLPAFLAKVLQLYDTVLVRHGLMLVGPTLAGKSECYRVLAAALSSAAKAGRAGMTKVRYHVICPKAVTLGELYGSFDETSHEWADGILANTFRQCASPEVVGERRWIVLDGPVDAVWIESLNTVLDDNRKLCLNSGEIIKLTGTMTMIFETEDLAHASPATVSRCGMVYMEPAALGWEPLVKSWLATVSGMVKERLLPLIAATLDWILAPCIGFLRGRARPSPVAAAASACAGSQAAAKSGKAAAASEPYRPREVLATDDGWLVASFLRLLEAQLAELAASPQMDSLRDRELGIRAEAHVLFALTWGVAGALDAASRPLWSQFLRELLAGAPESGGHGKTLPSKQTLPDGLGAHDIVWLPEENRWAAWMEKQPKYVVPAEAQFHEIVVPTADTVRYCRVLRLLVEHGKHALLVGETGTGKSLNVARVMAGGPAAGGVEPDKWAFHTLNFSARTSAAQTQDIVDGKVEKRRKGVYGPTFGKRFVVFVDDLNMPAREKYGAQPPIELLRQWMNFGGWFDRRSTDFKHVVDTQFVGAMGPPGGGRNPVTHRFLRHFVLIGLTPYDDESLRTVFGTILESRLKGFQSSVHQLTQPLVAATVAIYRQIARSLLPTPARSHYTFNLRDLGKVFQGLIMADPKRMKVATHMLRLWAHECERVFCDRLISEEDREWYRRFVGQVAEEHFKVPFSQVVGPNETLLFGSFLGEDGGPVAGDAEGVPYAELPSIYEAQRALEAYLARHNRQARTPMRLVLFSYAVQHVCRVHRIIRRPFGHALLVGVGGSGRQSLARLAAHMAEYELFTVEIGRQYGRVEWAEDCKRLLRKAGVDAQPCVLLLSDTQIVMESMLEDANSMLNAGEVPGVFAPEEMIAIADTLRRHAGNAGRGTSLQAVWAFFVERCRENLHVVLCMSPASDAFRTRLRMFPSLVNCCTIDWFAEWPSEALRSVGMQELADVDLDAPVARHSHGLHRRQPSEAPSEGLSASAHGPAVVSAPASNLSVGASSFHLPPPPPSGEEEDGAREEEGAGRVEHGLKNSTVVDCAVAMHESVLALARRFHAEQRRPVAVPPTSFLELIGMFKAMLEKRRESVRAQRQRYLSGLDKLLATAKHVKELQGELRSLQPTLLAKTQEIELLVKRIEAETVEAEQTKVIMKGEEQEASEATDVARAIKAECEAELQLAMPQYMEALEALQTLDKADIVEVRSMKSPPHGVKLVMEATCILMGIKPRKKGVPEGESPYWEVSKKELLGDPKFLQRLVEFDKDNIPDARMELLAPYMDNDEFLPEKVARASKAARGLCMFIRAMGTYHRVVKEVAPKKARLVAAEDRLRAVVEQLNAKKESLRLIELQIADLTASYRQGLGDKEALQEQVASCELRLERAQKLLGGLVGEKDRWTAAAHALGAQFENMVGDALLACGALAYLGPFTKPYRDECAAGWLELLDERCVAMGDAWSLVGCLGDPVRQRQWLSFGLPSDPFSTENALIVTEARRWPLIIDPQGQATAWIKRLEKDRGLMAAKARDPELLRVLQNAVQLGTCVLVENVGTALDPALDPLLSRQVVQRGEGLVVRIGEHEVEYSPDFRLYLATPAPNPSFAPELAAKVTVVNFSLTEEGLAEQLLGVVVAAERPELEKEKNELIAQSASNRRELRDLEDTVLSLLANAEGNLLENEKLIKTLQQCKSTSEEINARVKMAEYTEKKIDETRGKYRPVAARAAALFFVVSELHALDPMYQFSLAAHSKLFEGTIAGVPKEETLEGRLASLAAHFTQAVYAAACRSLFERHKLPLSLALALKAVQSDDRLAAEAAARAREAEVREARAAAGGPQAGGGAQAKGGPAASARDSTNSPRRVPTTPGAHRRDARRRAGDAVGAAHGAAAVAGARGGPRAGAAALEEEALELGLPPFAPPEPRVDPAELRFLLTGGALAAPDEAEAPGPAWLAPSSSPSSASSPASRLRRRRRPRPRPRPRRRLARLGRGARPAPLPAPLRPAPRRPRRGPAAGPAQAPRALPVHHRPRRPPARRPEPRRPSLAPAPPRGPPPLPRRRRPAQPAAAGQAGPGATSPFVSPLLGPLPTPKGPEPAGIAAAMAPPAVPPLGLAPPPAAPKGLSPFQLLLLVRVLAPAKLVPAVSDFIAGELGAAFVEPPPMDVPAAYRETGPDTPLLFLLSPGADPVPHVTRLAQQLRFHLKLAVVSLGQGQGALAERHIRDAAKRGAWVLLQNCHLAASWMPALERLVDQAAAGDLGTVHPSFRLFLTSAPTPAFPVSVLRSAVKVAAEAPRGVRALLQRAYAALSPEFVDGAEYCQWKADVQIPGNEKKKPPKESPARTTFKRLLYALCFFHAAALERRKYGPLGWNVRYEFTEGDLAVSVRQLHAFLLPRGEEGPAALPLKTLHYLVGHANYGGRVTDDWDRRALLALLTESLSEQAAAAAGHRLTPSGLYRAPADGPYEGVLEHVRGVPARDEPEVFGLHPNAELAYGLADSASLLSSLLALQPRDAPAPGGHAAAAHAPAPVLSPAPSRRGPGPAPGPPAGSKEGAVLAVAAEIVGRLAGSLEGDAAATGRPAAYEDPMSVVLAQELQRYGRLLAAVRASLADLRAALSGLAPMSPELEALAQALFDGAVPAAWAARSYPTLKPLASWLADLCARLAYLQRWADEGPPANACFWLPAFFFPQAFLTAVLQGYARRHRVPIDILSFRFAVTRHSGAPGDEPAAAPPDGCYVRGLFLEGARWDPAAGCLAEQRARELRAPFPVLQLLPFQTRTYGPAGTAGRASFKDTGPGALKPGLEWYACPCYKTAGRAGTLSTTGHSTNYVLTVHLPSDRPEAFWVRRSAALLCSLPE
eukprot:tig00000142_g8641.t1